MRSRGGYCCLVVALLAAVVMGLLANAGVALAETARSDSSYVVESNGEDDPFKVEPQKVADPLEKFNRAMFHFNDKLYFWFLKPVSRVYQAFIPQGVRICIRNAYYNVLMPVRLLNCTFQGKFHDAGTELARFTINTTLGAGGMFDFANTEYKLQKHDEDFGQTLGRYGMSSYAYITWPLLGPSSVRDSLGSVVDAFMNPLTYISPEPWVSPAIRGGTTVNNTSLVLGEYEDFKASALDPYVSLRDAYLQNRARAIQK
jgi:phospholipid-binding lipoprotein MlaA